MRTRTLFLALLLVLGLAARAAAELTVTSPAFTGGGTIPPVFTCSGRDMNPAVAFGGAPAGTKSLALVMDDPDAPGGTWVHWVAYNLPARSAGLPENLPRTPVLEGLAVQGTNSWGRIGYGGPCPPSGAHRYVFTLYALDAELPLRPGATAAELVRAMQGHVLAAGRLMGRFGR